MLCLREVEVRFWRLDGGMHYGGIRYGENLHHADCHAPAGAGLETVAFVRWRGVGAAFAHVPRQAGAGLLWVAHVWC